MKYAKMDWGTMEAVVNMLGGMEGVQRLLRNELVIQEAVPSQILRLLSAGVTITIGKCDGKQSLAQAKKTFPSYIDSDFKKWGLDKAGVATEETQVQVYELVKDAIMFGSIGTDLDKLCMTQHQIKQFCENHSNWLRADGYGTFFLFRVEDQFFVAHVNVLSSGLCVYVNRFELDCVWRAEFQHRLVSPQLTV